MALSSLRHQWRKSLCVVETAREAGLEVEPEDEAELLQSHDKAFNR